MSKTKTVNVQTVSGASLLTLLFVYLKLTGHIDWSWWWVTAPSWIPLALVLAFVGVFMVVGLIAAVLKK